MNVNEMFAWMEVAQVAIAAGIATVDTIKGWIKARHEMTEAELDQVCGLVFDDATRRKALAITDALGTKAA